MGSSRDINDPRLSLKALGLLALLLDHAAANKPVDIEEIRQHCRDGVESIRSGIKELRQAGYIYKAQKRDPENGTFLGWETCVFETPQQSRS